MEMQIEKRPSTAAKKLRNMVRVLYYMIKSGLLKTKLLSDAHVFLKRGKLVASKAITSLIFHHHHQSVASPPIPEGEYEFSCSNTPNFYHFFNRRNKHPHYYHDDDNVVSPQLRISDSPFSLKTSGEVDREAEDFINKFYKELRLQSIHSPFHSSWARY